MVTKLSFGLVTCLLLLASRAATAEESHAGAAADDLHDETHRDAPGDDAAEGRERAAKDSFGEGLRLLRQGEWHEAELRFRDSRALVRRQSTEYNLAFVLYMQHRRRESLAVLEQLEQPGDEGADPRYQQYGAVLKSRVEAELSTLRVLVTPATAQVRIDGETPMGNDSERSLVVDPGDHGVEISAPGYVTKRVVFATRAGADVEREVALDRMSSAAPPTTAVAAHDVGSSSAWSRGTVAPWVVTGVGGALLVTAAVTGILAKEADDDFQKKCPTNKDCSPSLTSLRDRVVTLGHTTDILLVSGSVLVVGGLTWRLLIPAPKASADHTAFVTVSGRF